MLSRRDEYHPVFFMIKKISIVIILLIQILLIQIQPVQAEPYGGYEDPRDYISNEVDPNLGDMEEGCRLSISICDLDGFYTCPITFRATMTSGTVRVTGGWWDGEYFSSFRDAISWSEPYKITNLSYSCGDWPPGNDEENNDEENNDEENNDEECEDIICKCVEGIETILEEIKQILTEIKESLTIDEANGGSEGGINIECSISEYEPIDLQPRSFQDIMGLLSNKMPFDAWGNTEMPATDGCVDLQILERNIKVCAFGFAGRLFGQIAGLILILRAIIRG